MDAIVAALIALMPFFAMAPLGIAAVAIVALLASPALRAALAAWAQRRLGGAPVRAHEELEHEVRSLRSAVGHLERRLDLAERVLVLDRRVELPAADRAEPAPLGDSRTPAG